MILLKNMRKGGNNDVVGNIGPFAFERLKSGGARIYLARKMNAAKAIELFQQGELQELNEPTAAKSIRHKAHNHD